MMKSTWLESHLDSLQAIQDMQQLQIFTEKLRDRLEVAHVVYHWINSAGRRFGAGTYCTDWVDRYLDRMYVHIDPVIIGSAQRSGLTNWKEFDWSSRKAQKFLSDAIEHGLGDQGISIPIHGPKGRFALFSVNASCSDASWQKFINEKGRPLTLMAYEMDQKAIEFEKSDENFPLPALSPRELSALTLLAEGKNRAQAASELDISENTLRVYIESARHKLGAMNTTHAVARALRSGIIVS